MEAKQYLRAATRNPADALVDYLRAHPSADVMVVAHGPLGVGVEGHVPPGLAARAQVHRHVRPGRPVEQDRFRAALASALPPPTAPEVVRLELSWDSTVKDLDLHVTGAGGEICWTNLRTTDGVLRGDARSGGPEILDFERGGSRPLTVTVHRYGEPWASVTSARPRVVVFCDDGTAFLARPLQDDAEATGLWTVGRLPQGGGWESAEHTITIDLPSGTRTG